MHKGPRYPGSLVVHHVKQQALEIASKYRRQRKRATELPRAVSLLLAWEGALVAGAFLSAIAYVAASAYMMERFDERTRRTSLVRYYQQRCDLAEEAVKGLQASIEYYRRHSEAAERQLEATTATFLELQRRKANQNLKLVSELQGWQQHQHQHPQKPAAPAGPGSRNDGGSESDGGGFFGWRVLGFGAAVLGPWRELYVRWRVAGWQRGMQVLDREAAHLEQSLRHDQEMAGRARDKLRCLGRELLHEIAQYEALHWRLATWRGHRCREQLASFSGTFSFMSRGASVGGAEGGGVGGGSRCWGWSLEVYRPAWMDDDENLLALPPLPEGEEGEGGPGGRGPGDGGEGAGGSGLSPELDSLLAALRPLFDDSYPRWR